MLPMVFEPTTPASERLQNHTLDRPAIRFGCRTYTLLQKYYRTASCVLKITVTGTVQNSRGCLCLLSGDGTAMEVNKDVKKSCNCSFIP